MRYVKNKIFHNSEESYRRYLKKRGIKKIIQHATTKFRHPELKDLANFDRINYIWKTGDRYFKLADKYYGDSTKWWVIALYNQKPTDCHVSAGEVIYVPHPIESVLYYLGY